MHYLTTLAGVINIDYGVVVAQVFSLARALDYLLQSSVKALELSLSIALLLLFGV